MNDKFQIGDLPSFDQIEQGTSAPPKTSDYGLTPERFMVDEDVIDQDYSYLKKVSPPVVSQLSDQIEEECDRLEYEGSLLYDQYPDKTTLLKMTDRIAKTLPEQTAISPKDLILALLCDEILYRRCRYYRKKKQFQ